MTAKNNGKRLPNLRILVISLTEASRIEVRLLALRTPQSLNTSAVFRSNIYHGGFCENRLKAVNYLPKKLYVKCLTGFWIHHKNFDTEFCRMEMLPTFWDLHVCLITENPATSVQTWTDDGHYFNKWLSGWKLIF